MRTRMDVAKSWRLLVPIMALLIGVTLILGLFVTRSQPASASGAYRDLSLAPGSTPAGCAPSWEIIDSPSPNPSRNILYGVEVISANDVWAVGVAGGYVDGGRGLIEHWDGNSWSVVPGPDPLTNTLLWGVSAVSANDVWATGYGRRDSDGPIGSFTAPGSQGQSDSAGQAPAVGMKPVILHWNGSRWTSVSSPIPGRPDQNHYLLDVDALATNDVWAVGEPYEEAGSWHDYILHWDGSTWNLVPGPSGYHDLFGVEAISTNDVWAVARYITGGASSRILHWDGISWSEVPDPIVANGGLLAVSGTAADDVWAVGYANGGHIILHWNGIQWDSHSIAGDAGAQLLHTSQLYGVTAIAPDDAWAVGVDVYGTLTMHWDGAAWTIVPSPNAQGDNVLFGVDAASNSNVPAWTVGGSGYSAEEYTLIQRYGFNCPTATPISTVTNTPTSPASTSTVSTASPTPAVTSTASPTPVVTATAEATSTATATATSQPTGTASPTACTMTFSDVVEGSTFYPFIHCLACREIISGYDDGTFRPFNDITRGQIAKIVSNSAGFDEDPGPQIYEDVPEGSPFYDSVNRLSKRGHIGGYPCGLLTEEPCIEPDNLPYFRPSNGATRGQLAKIVSNAAGLDTMPTGVFYTDVQEDHPFYLWIMRLTELGVMSGYDCGVEGEPCDEENRPYFRPYNNVTRGQASKIVANTFFPGCQTPARPNP